MTEILLIFVVFGISLILRQQRKNQKDIDKRFIEEYQRGFHDGKNSVLPSLNEDDSFSD